MKTAAHKPIAIAPVALLSSKAGGAVKVPDWIMLIPAGQFQTNDGRGYNNSNPDAVLLRTQKNGLSLPGDINHDIEKGSSDPAMGWVNDLVKDLEVRDGEIWARVEWTDVGSSALLSKHYRYVSPAFNHDEDGNVLDIRSFALVNKPALIMPALANSQKTAKAMASQTPQTETSMDEETLAQLRKILNLDDTADEAAVQAALDTAAKAVEEASEKTEEVKPAKSDEKLAEKVDEKTAEGDEKQVSPLPENPNPEVFVYKADYDAVAAQLAEHGAKDSDAPTGAEITEAVETAMASGRISPITKDHHIAMCSTRSGLNSFKAMVKVAPKIVPTEKSQKAMASKERTNHGLSSNQMAMCSRMGLDPKAYATTLAKDKK